jgi:shikimate kinase
VKLRGNENLILIGMPGAGKSTVGKHLARHLSVSFLDTDQVIEERWGRSLQQIIESEGLEAFRFKEEKTIVSLNVARYVISTGGSVVYYPRAMKHLKDLGRILWLDLPLEEIERRVADGMDDRGLVRTPEQTLADLYRERTPLYERYAEIRVDAMGKTDEHIVREILDRLNLTGPTRGS